MKTTNEIQNKIDTTMNSMDHTNDVMVSPFFKDKVLQKLFTEKKDPQHTWSWFTPQLQFTTLICVVMVNLFALVQLNAGVSEHSLEEFSSAYDLITTTDDNSIFN